MSKIYPQELDENNELISLNKKRVIKTKPTKPFREIPYEETLKKKVSTKRRVQKNSTINWEE